VSTNDVCGDRLTARPSMERLLRCLGVEGRVMSFAVASSTPSSRDAMEHGV
jgi:hypothetical protein